MNKKYKILNLYACLGGNRYKWDEVADNLEITAVELDPELAKMYQKRFPNDKVIIADAHQYLLDHYKEFDFIWSSPPCPTHSKMALAQKNTKNWKVNYPDMTLYQEILFLDNYFEGKYVVENVIPFYKPLIPAKKRGRHLYWTNFNLPSDLGERKEGKGLVGSSVKGEVKLLEQFHAIDISEYKGTQRKDKVCRNLVDYEAGKTILMTVFNIKRETDVKQISLWDAIQ